MLELKNIKKTYETGSGNVEALKGINLKFRESEFVSILGESGCGKTTLLNIIGGLDRYTTGDLIINGKSTKKFKDRDWDSYRNYSVGFIFQSYNLISHQTILSNVELALTISGVSKEERRKRAIKVLTDVGLKDKIYHKPNQLSGGQMQRVAIARALVNNPDIILADEPTGALDSKTSISVMEILKKVSKDKLVIMVTHNDGLAEKYSDRIINILDGKITGDSNPIKKKEKFNNIEDKYRKTVMRFTTALGLSFNNLLTKKGRTILTSFAGSIGIIGIALILSISTGVQDYIDKVEEDTLSSYPLTIEKSVIDISAMMESMMDASPRKEFAEDTIYSKNILNNMLHSMSNKVETNNLEEFKKYLDSEDNDVRNNSNGIMYNYNLKLNLYKNSDTEVYKTNPSDLFEVVGMGDMLKASESMSSYMGSSMTNTDIFIEMLDNEKLLKSQYDLLKGSWPSKYNEVVLIVGESNEVSDYVLYNLGLLDKNEIKNIATKIQDGEEVEEKEVKEYSFDDFIGLEYKIILNSDYYQKENNIWIDKSEDKDYMLSKLKDAETIKIVGIIRHNAHNVSDSMMGGVGYTKDLKEYVINKTDDSEVVKYQKENNTKNIFTGMDFPEEDSEFDINNMPDEFRYNMMYMTSSEIAKMMEAYKDNANASYEGNLDKLGSVDLDSPSSISIYPKGFESKENISKAIEKYNKDKKEEDKITYTDVVGTMIDSVSNIINTISYVLIAFVAVSLIVSSIMIGIITYISVIERTKEIGILRSIGVSKKDVSRIFNAETLIIGFISGVIGVGITMLFTIPINALIYKATNVMVTTRLPLGAAIVLIIISIILTLIGGSIPARIASKQDPVIALRSE